MRIRGRSRSGPTPSTVSAGSHGSGIRAPWPCRRPHSPPSTQLSIRDAHTCWPNCRVTSRRQPNCTSTAAVSSTSSCRSTTRTLPPTARSPRTRSVSRPRTPFRSSARTALCSPRGHNEVTMKPDDSTAVIEIIDDDTNPFGDRAQTHTVDDTGGPRWVGPVAAAALFAIVGFGVVTSASKGAPKVAPAPITTTTVAPTTTLATSSVPPSTVPAAPRIGYYAASPADDFTIEFADAGEVGRAFFPGIYELWATPDSSATSGRWFSIQTEPGPPYSENAYRVQAGDLSIALSHTASGLTVVTFAATEAGSVTITALGSSDDHLLRLAQSVRIGRATMS